MKINTNSLIIVILAILFVGQSVYGYPDKYLITGENVVQDKWFGNYYFTDGRNDDILRVGGWGDHYYTLIKMPVHFNMPGRYILNGATLNLQSVGSTRSTPMHKWFVLDSWSETSTTDHWNLGIIDGGIVQAPLENGLYSMDIGKEFYTWLVGAAPNYGILLTSDNVDNHFNYFRSSKNKLEWRPYIEVSYERVPHFKLPLPGNKAWKLTTEAGGKLYNSQSELDSAHTRRQYYSLDFSPRWIPITGGSEQTATDVPVYAAAGGVVVESTFTSANGYYVKIDHDYDANLNTGFQTVYLHMKQQPSVNQYSVVNQGDQLGIMGNTGISDGTHLHITFYFENDAGTSPAGYDASVQLNYVEMEDFFLKDFDLNTNWRTDLDPDQYDPAYYPSTNTPYP